MLSPELEALRPFATKRQAEFLDAVKVHGSNRKAAQALGCNNTRIVDAFRRLKIAAARQGHAPGHWDSGVAPGYHMGKVTVQRGSGGHVERVWERQHPDQEAAQKRLEEFVDRLAEQVHGTAKRNPGPTVANATLLSAYLVGDAHLGAYAWGTETGAEDYDTDIATADLRGAFNHLVRAAPASEIGMLVNVGDFLHANDTTSQTPSSKHLLDTDGRFSQVIDRAVVVFRYAVDLMLKKHQQVWIINARGNHDPDAAIWLNKVLVAYYHNEPRVRVIDNASKFLYVEWGKVLIGVHHGDRIKRQQLYEAMTRDKREAWGQASHVYFWTGHIHHKTAEEIGGCLFESFNTLAAPDAWHAGQGYGSNREMQQITLHQQFGIVGRNVCGLEMARLAA